MAQAAVKDTTGYVNYVYNISARGTTEVASQLMGLSGMATNILGQLAFQTSSYLSTTEGALLSMGVVATAGFGKAIQQASEFDQALSTVGAISGKTRGEVESLGDDAMAMSSKFGVAVSEMTQGMESLARAGVSQGNMTAILEEAMGLSKLEGLTLDTAINDLISTTNLLDTQGLDLSSPEYAEAVKYQNQKITATSEAAPINAQDIIHTLEHIGGYASSTNLDQDDLYAVIAQLGSKGTKSEMAGTSLRAFISAGQKDTAQRALDRIGLNVKDLWKNDETILSITDMKDVLDEAMESKGYTQQEKLEFYSDFAGYKQANQIMKIDTQSAREFKQKIDESWNMGQKIGQVIGTAETHIQGLVQAGTNLLTKVGEPFLPIVSTIAFTLKTGIDIINAIPGSNLVIAGGLILASVKAISTVFNKIAPQIVAAKGNIGDIRGLFMGIREDVAETYTFIKNINNPDFVRQKALENEAQHVTDQDKIKYWREQTNEHLYGMFDIQQLEIEHGITDNQPYIDWKLAKAKEPIKKPKEKRNEREEQKTPPKSATESSNNRESNKTINLTNIEKKLESSILSIREVNKTLESLKFSVKFPKSVLDSLTNKVFNVRVINSESQIVPVHDTGMVAWNKRDKFDSDRTNRVEKEQSDKQQSKDKRQSRNRSRSKNLTSEEKRYQAAREKRADINFRKEHRGSLNVDKIKKVRLFENGQLTTEGMNDFINALDLDFGLDLSTSEGKQTQEYLANLTKAFMEQKIATGEITLSGQSNQKLKSRINKELSTFMTNFKTDVDNTIIDGVKFYSPEDLQEKLSTPRMLSGVSRKQDIDKAYYRDKKKKKDAASLGLLKHGLNPLRVSPVMSKTSTDEDKIEFIQKYINETDDDIVLDELDAFETLDEKFEHVKELAEYMNFKFQPKTSQVNITGANKTGGLDLTISQLKSFNKLINQYYDNMQEIEKTDTKDQAYRKVQKNLDKIIKNKEVNDDFLNKAQEKFLGKNKKQGPLSNTLGLDITKFQGDEGVNVLKSIAYAAGINIDGAKGQTAIAKKIDQSIIDENTDMGEALQMANALYTNKLANFFLNDLDHLNQQSFIKEVGLKNTNPYLAMIELMQDGRINDEGLLNRVKELGGIFEGNPKQLLLSDHKGNPVYGTNIGKGPNVSQDPNEAMERSIRLYGTTGYGGFSYHISEMLNAAFEIAVNESLDDVRKQLAKDWGVDNVTPKQAMDTIQNIYIPSRRKGYSRALGISDVDNIDLDTTIRQGAQYIHDESRGNTKYLTGELGSDYKRLQKAVFITDPQEIDEFFVDEKEKIGNWSFNDYIRKSYTPEVLQANRKTSVGSANNDVEQLPFEFEGQDIQGIYQRRPVHGRDMNNAAVKDENGKLIGFEQNEQGDYREAYTWSWERLRNREVLQGAQKGLFAHIAMKLGKSRYQVMQEVTDAQVEKANELFKQQEFINIPSFIAHYDDLFDKGESELTGMEALTQLRGQMAAANKIGPDGKIKGNAFHKQITPEEYQKRLQSGLIYTNEGNQGILGMTNEGNYIVNDFESLHYSKEDLLRQIVLQDVMWHDKLQELYKTVEKMDAKSIVDKMMNYETNGGEVLLKALGVFNEDLYNEVNEIIKTRMVDLEKQAGAQSSEHARIEGSTKNLLGTDAPLLERMEAYGLTGWIPSSADWEEIYSSDNPFEKALQIAQYNGFHGQMTDEMYEYDSFYTPHYENIDISESESEMHADWNTASLGQVATIDKESQEDIDDILKGGGVYAIDPKDRLKVDDDYIKLKRLQNAQIQEDIENHKQMAEKQQNVLKYDMSDAIFNVDVGSFNAISPKKRYEDVEPQDMPHSLSSDELNIVNDRQFRSYIGYKQFGINVKNRAKNLVSPYINAGYERFGKTDNSEVSSGFQKLSDKLFNTTEHLQGFSTFLEEASDKFPPLIGAVLALDGVIGTLRTVQQGSGFIQDFLQLNKTINNLKNGDIISLFGFDIEGGSNAAKMLATASGTLGTVITTLQGIIMEFLGPITLIVGSLLAIKTALDWSYQSHEKYLKSLEEEQKEHRSRVKGLQATNENAQKTARENRAPRQQAAFDRNAQLAQTRLDNANMTRSHGAIEITRQKNDTLWGDYGISAGLSKISGNYESTASEYEGTTEQTRKIKEATLANPFSSNAMNQVSSYYDANQLAFGIMDEYKDELGKLYDAETSAMLKYHSDDVRGSPEFNKALDDFVEATGITRDHAKQYLDYMQTEHEVDRATQTMQAQADQISASTELKVQAIAFGGNPADVLGLNGIEAQQDSMIKAQADMIKMELSGQLWWKAVWSTITTPIKLILSPIFIIVDLLNAIWSLMTGNIGGAFESGGRAASRLNVFGEAATYWGAWADTESTDFNAIGQSATDSYNRANYGNVEQPASGGYHPTHYIDSNQSNDRRESQTHYINANRGSYHFMGDRNRPGSQPTEQLNPLSSIGSMLSTIISILTTGLLVGGGIYGLTKFLKSDLSLGKLGEGILSTITGDGPRILGDIFGGIFKEGTIMGKIKDKFAPITDLFKDSFGTRKNQIKDFFGFDNVKDAGSGLLNKGSGLLGKIDEKIGFSENPVVQNWKTYFGSKLVTDDFNKKKRKGMNASDREFLNEKYNLGIDFDETDEKGRRKYRTADQKNKAVRDALDEKGKWNEAMGELYGKDYVDVKDAIGSRVQGLKEDYADPWREYLGNQYETRKQNLKDNVNGYIGGLQEEAERYRAGDIKEEDLSTGGRILAKGLDVKDQIFGKTSETDFGALIKDPKKYLSDPRNIETMAQDVYGANKNKILKSDFYKNMKAEAEAYRKDPATGDGASMQAKIMGKALDWKDKYLQGDSIQDVLKDPERTVDILQGTWNDLQGGALDDLNISETVKDKVSGFFNDIKEGAEEGIDDEDSDGGNGGLIERAKKKLAGFFGFGKEEGGMPTQEEMDEKEKSRDFTKISDWKKDFLHKQHEEQGDLEFGPKKSFKSRLKDMFGKSDEETPMSNISKSLEPKYPKYYNPNNMVKLESPGAFGEAPSVLDLDGLGDVSDNLKTGGKIAQKAGGFLKGKGGKLGKVGNVLNKVGGGASKAGAKGIGGMAKGGIGKAAKGGIGKAAKGGIGKLASKGIGKVGSKLAAKGIAQVGSKVLGGALIASGIGAPLGLLLESPIGGALIEGAMDLGGKALGAVGGAIGGAVDGVKNFLGFGKKSHYQQAGGGIGGGLGAMGGLGMMAIAGPIGMGVGLLGSIFKTNKDQKNNSQNIGDIAKNILKNIVAGNNKPNNNGSGGNITIQNININTADDPEAIKAMFLELLIELQEQVNPRLVSRTVGEPPAAASSTTPTDTTTTDPNATNTNDPNATTNNNNNNTTTNN